MVGKSNGIVMYIMASVSMMQPSIIKTTMLSPRKAIFLSDSYYNMDQNNCQHSELNSLIYKQYYITIPVFMVLFELNVFP
jgi:hypothetical protein